MISLHEIAQAYKLASETEKEDFVNAIMPDVEKNPIFQKRVNEVVEATLKNTFDARLAVSELHPIKRIAKLEQVTGIEEYFDDEEHELTIPERIEGLEDKIESCNFRPSESPCIDKIPETKTEIRASLLVEALEASKKPYFSASEIIDFLKCKLPDSCKIDTNVKNIRKVKQDVVSKAVEMFSSIVEPNKKTTGHRDIRLVLKS